MRSTTPLLRHYPVFCRVREDVTYGLPGGHSEREPPDPIPNSEVKTLSADDSMGSPYAKVGHCQAFNAKPPLMYRERGFFCLRRLFARLLE